MKMVLLCVTALLCAWAAENVNAPSADANDYFRAIRANDLKTLRQLTAAGSANVRDKLDMSALHYAALYGSTESVRLLLDAGADVNARNKSQATPLLYGAYSFEKTKLLVGKGADVNAENSSHLQPLWVAVGAHGNQATVRYLIEHGADVKAMSAGKTDYLQRAAYYSEPEVVKLLLDKGLDPRHASTSGLTALMYAFFCDDDARVKMLLDAGSDVNAANTSAGKVKNGDIALNHLTPLMLAAPEGDPAMVKALIAKGANVNAVDVRDMTPLMLAVATETANPEIVRALIAAGTNLNVKDVYGDTALDWARKYRDPEILAALEKAGASGHEIPTAPARPADYRPQPREAIERATALLAASSEKFFPEGGGCVGCHHQPMAGSTFAALRAAGLQPDPRLRRVLTDGMIAERPILLALLPTLVSGGGDYDAYLYPAAAMAELGEPASPLTDVIVHFLVARQMPSGAWSLPDGPRVPLQSSDVKRTMMAIRILKAYGWPARQAEFDASIARARTWLLSVRPENSLDRADLLVGLWLTGSSKSDLRAHADSLLREQRAGGGWAQNSHLDSDAYATGMVLHSLWETGMLKAADKPYKDGVANLLNGQYPDGSWYVRSRAPKLQPYFQSGFPYDHNQWISAAATAYAVMALAPAAKE